MKSIFALALCILVPAGIANADQIFKATLSGDQEVPPVDTVATGRAKFRVSDDLSKVEFTLTVNDGTRVQVSHIHCGAAGENGPVFIFLAGAIPEGLDIDGEWVSNATFTDANIVLRTTPCGATLADVVAAMQAGMTYANVHTVANPGGEIRGQIQATSDCGR